MESQFDARNTVNTRFARILVIAALVAPAVSRSAEVLPPIDSHHAVKSVVLPAEAGVKFDWDSANFAALPSGFNLISSVQSLTPSEFNIQVSPTQPLTGAAPMDNFISLLVWDAADKVWYFYSPTLEASGGLAAVKAYADSHFFRHFQDYNKQLDLGAGFWVNRR